MWEVQSQSCCEAPSSWHLLYRRTSAIQLNLMSWSIQMKIARGMLAGLGLLVIGHVCASAQQITGTPGSPGATTTVPGTQLPSPDPKFGGVIKEKASESTPWWPPRVVPPMGAPNVLLIMTDDQGFGAPGTFGGVIPTPTMDRIARNGLRFTNFHSA